MSESLKVLVVAGSQVSERLRLDLVEAGWTPQAHTVDRLSELKTALADRWDAVLTEEAFPDADVIEVVRHVRAADPEVPCIVVAAVPPARATALMAAGCNEVITSDELVRFGRAMRHSLRAAERLVRRAAASEVDRTERELRSIIDLLPVGVMLRHGSTVAFVNRALAGYYGVPAQELIGRPVVELMRPEHRDTIRTRMAATNRGESVLPYEFRFDRRDGRVGVMLISSAEPLRFDGLPSVMVTMTDVTEERTLRDRLQMADRMAAVGTLAAGVAHEINNPLACVTANLEVLREELTPPSENVAPTARMDRSEVLEALDDAREGAERVRLIVRDLRLFARGDAGERGPVDLGGVLQAAERMAGNMVKARARVVQQHAPLPPVDGNATRLCQVFVNILVNAAQAIEAGRAEENEVLVRAEVEGERVVVEVRDTGVGIPADVRARIFDPFFSTKGIGGGHGLGLSVCHGIVTSFGGEISVAEGLAGRGTIVRVALPVWSR